MTNAHKHNNNKKNKAVFLSFSLLRYTPLSPHIQLLHVAIRHDRSPVEPNSSLMTSLNCVVRLMIVLPICQCWVMSGRKGCPTFICELIGHRLCCGPVRPPLPIMANRAQDLKSELKQDQPKNVQQFKTGVFLLTKS